MHFIKTNSGLLKNIHSLPWREIAIGIAMLIVALIDMNAMAQSAGPSLSLNINTGNGAGEISSAVKILIFMTLLSLAPAVLVTMTCFTRIIVVFSFIRQAIGIHQSPPNQVLIGLALFLTMFIMTPVFSEINETAIKPYQEDKIEQSEAIDLAMAPIRKFMYAQTHEKDLELMLTLSKKDRPKSFDDLSNMILIPSFILSELKTAFEIGFIIYIPFVLVDMLVAMVLLTMGMMVLPPVLISLPFKLMLFVLVDGWDLLIGSLVRSFS